MSLKKLLLPLILAVTASAVQPDQNVPTRPEDCIPSWYSKKCAYCGSWDGQEAVLVADTGLPDRVCTDGYCGRVVSGHLICFEVLPVATTSPMA
ncbi:hypothetical protein F4780DRAFT_782071 [Xylariomycetidae sp. FL0641]|nr:hypothetical protein F4780DRAFT_782071 [Xylariomycetidae sp. FL0641]